MCGIAGSVNSPLPVASVQALLRHRGPDDQTAWQDGTVELIHTRLAIQELSAAGRQPMHHGDFHVVFNGEIYNHIELRARFGLKCQSNSDTETLLHLFDRVGINMLAELDGMFAFALYDATHQKIWLVRDRAGEKPLYYFRQGKLLVFSSTLRVVQQQVRAAVNTDNILMYLSVGYLPGSLTPFTGIQELEAGHYIEMDIRSGHCKKVAWWSITPAFQAVRRLSRSDALAEADRLLRLSVTRRMVSADVEVGCFLSGGIDSGLVAALARESDAGLRTFTVTFDGMYNEAPLAAATARHLGTKHTEIPVSFDELPFDIENIFSHYGEPMMDDSIIPSYYVSREARRFVSVVLTGDAGDELFGGYRRYVPVHFLNLFAGFSPGVFTALERALPAPSNKMGAYNYAHRLVALLAQPGPAAYFAATTDLLHRESAAFLRRPSLEALTATIQGVIDQPISPLRKMLQLDFGLLLPAVLLVKMDVSSMAHALETRAPFLSKELLEWAPGLDDGAKIRKTQTKYLLRRLAARYLPPEIPGQPKRGFEVPLQAWMEGCLREIIFDRLNRPTSYVAEFIHFSFIRALLEKRVRSVTPEQRARILFSWLSLDCWNEHQKSW